MDVMKMPADLPDVSLNSNAELVLKNVTSAKDWTERPLRQRRKCSGEWRQA